MKWRVLSYLLLGAGALVLLAPLASRGLALRTQQQFLRQFEATSPVVLAPSPEPEPTIEPPTPRPQVPPKEPAPPPPPGSYILEIPEIGLRYVVMDGIDDHHLAKGPGHYPQTPQPGAAGNSAIAGHRTVRGQPSFFYNLHRLKAGSLITVTYPERSLTYTVEQVFITDPYDRSVLAPTAVPTLTLTTCDPPGTDENRLIVRATLRA